MSGFSTVVVVGAGPTGLFLALRLAQAGIQVTVIEAKPELDEPTKALAHMPTIFPLYRQAGVLEEILEAAGELRSTGAVFRNSADLSVIAEMPHAPNRPGPCVLPQGHFSKILLRKLRSQEGQRVLFGCTFTSFDEAEDSISVHFTNSDGGQQEIKASYLVAADGGKSPVRKLAGIPFEGETLPYQLVATDLRYPVEEYGWDRLKPNFLAGENYGLLTPIDSKGLWRCSYGVSLESGASLAMDDIKSTLLAKLSQMLPGAPGEKASGWEIVNVAPYKAQQLCAQTLRKGRVLLIGDAAHLTNPYAGMGLNMGIFDAASLADALICILQRSGAANPLLDGWSASRRTLFAKFVDPMSRAAFAAMRDLDADTLPQRHPMLKALKMPGAKPPDISTDVSKLEGWVA